MALSIEAYPRQQATVLACKGIIVFGDEANSLRAQVKGVLSRSSSSPPIIVLDLSGVQYVDSGGVGTLVGLLTSVRSAGGDLKLVAPNQRIRKVLTITHLIEVFKIYASVEEAVTPSAAGAGGSTVER